ncbi:hypothetical protein [Arthrobacter oryzae]|jgi:hypothetical protein|uniref:Uncharacterized protein n=1 Tax=Arthrobacter oryzae TaxID=409290 RepID=A0A495FM27_9MICC|nr:hypothetical protein [Arthrobacter oryzae]RKR29767.1 hypothetical protein C8D78_0080 [Arthrobacter oryzae]
MLSQQIATFVAAAGESGHEELAPLIAPPFVIGGSMFLLLVVLLLITLSYSNLGRRHEVVEEHSDPHRQHPNKHDHSQGH